VIAARVGAAAVPAYLALLLLVDRTVELPGQLVLGALTWVVLGAVLVFVSPVLRAQALVVVAVATCAEVIGSIIWGVYTYRLENLPSFVPPAHGLVYLGGLSLATALRRHHPLLVGTALVAVATWAVLGVTVLPRTDAGGAVGAIILAAFLLRGRAAATYAGVFLIVAALEIYGTAIGTWAWAETIPGTGVPNGNPPSGVAAGYVWFDIVALALAPRLLALTGRARAGRARSPSTPGPPLPETARSA
jgi:hypothetical protein